MAHLRFASQPRWLFFQSVAVYARRPLCLPLTARDMVMRNPPVQAVVVEPASVGGKAGAGAAALLCFAAVMLPTTVSAFMAPFVAGWWPVILVFSLPWVAIAAVLGYLAGRAAARANNLWMAAAVGAAVLGWSVLSGVPAGLLVPLPVLRQGLE